MYYESEHITLSNINHVIFIYGILLLEKILSLVYEKAQQ